MSLSSYSHSRFLFFFFFPASGCQSSENEQPTKQAHKQTKIDIPIFYTYSVPVLEHPSRTGSYLYYRPLSATGRPDAVARRSIDYPPPRAIFLPVPTYKILADHGYLLRKLLCKWSRCFFWSITYSTARLQVVETEIFQKSEIKNRVYVYPIDYTISSLCEVTYLHNVLLSGYGTVYLLCICFFHTPVWQYILTTHQADPHCYNMVVSFGAFCTSCMVCLAPAPEHTYPHHDSPTDTRVHAGVKTRLVSRGARRAGRAGTEPRPDHRQNQGDTSRPDPAGRRPDPRCRRPNMTFWETTSGHTERMYVQMNGPIDSFARRW